MFSFTWETKTVRKFPGTQNDKDTESKVPGKSLRMPVVDRVQSQKKALHPHRWKLAWRLRQRGATLKEMQRKDSATFTL